MMLHLREQSAVSESMASESRVLRLYPVLRPCRNNPFNDVLSGSQSMEEVALLYVDGKLANEGAILGIVSDFSSLACRSSKATPRALPSSYRTPLRRDVVRIVRTLDHGRQCRNF
jgi:hypothetical protein